MVDPLQRPGPARWAALAAIAAAVIALPPAARAVDNPLIGVWRTELLRADSKPYASIALGFDPKGRLQERVDAPSGQTFYSGVYSLSPDGTLLYRLDDYVPKSRCDGVACVTVQPTMPLGLLLSARIGAAGANSFRLLEGTETLIFMREQ
jgi:hypothetical protein